jgi:hypothetical protein
MLQHAFLGTSCREGGVLHSEIQERSGEPESRDL